MTMTNETTLTQMRTEIEAPAVAYVAAELGQVMRPYHAAVIAARLCRIGRAYKRAAEKLCGGEREWGAWTDSTDAAQDALRRKNSKRVAKAHALIKRRLITGSATIVVSGLVLVCESRASSAGPTNKTALL